MLHLATADILIFLLRSERAQREEWQRNSGRMRIGEQPAMRNAGSEHGRREV